MIIKALPAGNLFLPGSCGFSCNMRQGLMETEHVVCLESHNPKNAVDIDIYMKTNNLQFSYCIIDGGGASEL